MLDTVLLYTRRISNWLTGVSLLIMMAVIAADVFGRYVFHNPIVWAYEIATVYLLPAIIFLGLPSSFHSGAQIKIELFTSRMPEGARAFLSVVSLLAGGFFLALLAYSGAARAVTAFKSNEVFVGWINWPIWIASGFLAVGCLLTIVHIVQHIGTNQTEHSADEQDVFG